MAKSSNWFEIYILKFKSIGKLRQMFVVFLENLNFMNNLQVQPFLGIHV